MHGYTLSICRLFQLKTHRLEMSYGRGSWIYHEKLQFGLLIPKKVTFRDETCNLFLHVNLAEAKQWSWSFVLGIHFVNQDACVRFSMLLKPSSRRVSYADCFYHLAHRGTNALLYTVMPSMLLQTLGMSSHKSKVNPFSRQWITIIQPSCMSTKFIFISSYTATLFLPKECGLRF